MEGHPPGPVERLQRFLNRNIGEDGHPPFPDFSDVLKCVTLANEKDNLGWSKGQIMREGKCQTPYYLQNKSDFGRVGRDVVG